jgi:2-polyprenyl-3-methyl-5-hydroxy-6-metoxy-1,4-benzoquinol methylase
MDDPRPVHPPSPSASELSAIAARVYTRSGGGFVLRLLQKYRPFICPFGALIDLVRPGASVLDVGCGGGLFLALLTHTGRLGSGVGFDSSAAAIATAQAAALPNCRFLRLDAAEPWPAEPARFDVVSIIDVMHHVPPAHQREVIHTAALRIAPGGLLLYKDMCRKPLWRGWANRLHDLVLARQWIHYAPIEDVEQWAGDAGLRLEHSSKHNLLWYGHELRVFRKPPQP